MSNNGKQIPLSRLEVGKSGKIVRVSAPPNVRRRLLEMGLVPGENIFVQSLAPLGDPVEYVVRGTHLSLRRKDAANIIVEVNADGA